MKIRFRPEERETLMLVKPSGIIHLPRIRTELERHGLLVVQERILNSRALIERLYERHEGRYYFEDLIRKLSIRGGLGLLVATDQQATHVSDIVDRIVGPTCPQACQIGQLRALSTDSIYNAMRDRRAVRNIVHSSDDIDVHRELALIF